ncbi:MAG: hypothetical protein U1U88_000911 [Lawsonella clevelandensis]
MKIVADGRYGELLGAHMVVRGVRATARVGAGAEVGAHHGGDSRTVHVHPTLAEALKESVEGVLGK